jgi:hypothetical protein
MPMNEELQQLHDRATRGLPLTRDEQAALDAWYTEQDQREAEALARPATSPALAELRIQVQAAAARLVADTRRIEALTVENDELRHEIAALQQELLRRSPAGRT